MRYGYVVTYTAGWLPGDTYIYISYSHTPRNIYTPTRSASSTTEVARHTHSCTLHKYAEAFARRDRWPCMGYGHGTSG